MTRDYVLQEVILQLPALRTNINTLSQDINDVKSQLADIRGATEPRNTPRQSSFDEILIRARVLMDLLYGKLGDRARCMAVLV